MRVSLRKKISLYFTYKKSIKKIEKDLEKQFNIRIDRVGRLYTVLNIPQDVVEEPYNLRKSDIDTLADKFIREYSIQLSKFLNENGLSELFDFYDSEKVGKYSYLLVFGYSLFNTQKVGKWLIFRGIPLLIIISSITYLYFKHR